MSVLSVRLSLPRACSLFFSSRSKLTLASLTRKLGSVTSAVVKVRTGSLQFTVYSLQFFSFLPYRSLPWLSHPLLSTSSRNCELFTVNCLLKKKKPPISFSGGRRLHYSPSAISLTLLPRLPSSHC